MLSTLRRKFRTALQRAFLLAIFGAIFMIFYTFLNLEFCYKLMSRNTHSAMCKKFKGQEYTGSLCDELCNSDAFKDFRCPRNDMKTTVFTAQKNGEIYAIKRAKNIFNDLVWINSRGDFIYPKLEDFHHMIKMHILVTYNVTLDDDSILALTNQDIGRTRPEQMISLWRLYNDNNYMMSKLFEEKKVFPKILGTCGPYYATENLIIPHSDQTFIHFLSLDRRRLKSALDIMDLVLRLDQMEPEPLKICNMQLHMFGFTADNRIKYENAQYVQTESQVDKKISNGGHCLRDEDCNMGDCLGKCNMSSYICDHIQQNNNLQIFCKKILHGSSIFPGILASSKTPKHLMELVRNCINPQETGQSVSAQRLFAPNKDLAIRLYNEIKIFSLEIQKEKDK